MIYIIRVYFKFDLGLYSTNHKLILIFYKYMMFYKKYFIDLTYNF